MVASLNRLGGRNFVPTNPDNNIVSGVPKSKVGSVANGAVLNTQLQTLSSNGAVSITGVPVLAAPKAPLDAPKVKNRLENLSTDIFSLAASLFSLIGLGIEAAINHKSESPEDVAALMSKNFSDTLIQLANDVVNVASDSVPDGSSAGAILDILSSESRGGFGDSLVSVVSSILQMPKLFKSKVAAQNPVNTISPDVVTTSLQQGPSNYVSSMISDINDHSQGRGISASLRVSRVTA